MSQSASGGLAGRTRIEGAELEAAVHCFRCCCCPWSLVEARQSKDTSTEARPKTQQARVSGFKQHWADHSEALE